MRGLLVKIGIVELGGGVRDLLEERGESCVYIIIVLRGNGRVVVEESGLVFEGIGRRSVCDHSGIGHLK